MVRIFLVLIFNLCLASPVFSQLIAPSAIESETTGGQLIECRVSYFMSPWSDIIGEWYAVITPGLDPYSPSYTPSVTSWSGSRVPYGIETQWVCDPLPSPSGVVVNPWPPFVASGEAVPAPSVFGGCAFGFSSYGPPLGGPSAWLWSSGPMPVAQFLVPPSIGSLRGTWVFFIGWTLHSPNIFRFWGAWGRVA